MAIEVVRRSAEFRVHTRHGDRLEFVLHRAEERNDHDHGHYAKLLSGMLDERFKCNDSQWIADETQYGDIMFTVSANSEKLLEQALVACEEVVEKWVRELNVERMKSE